MAETDEKVRQVQTLGGLYDIEAGSLNPENDYDVKSMTVTNGLGPTVNFRSTSTPGGRINLNTKGNMSIEALTKHLNLEAFKSIQLKPTNKVIWDTGRRHVDTGENEAIIEVIDDDEKEWGSLKIKSRNMDLRCNDHGGIALQPCGQDGDDHENKIKFESSRTTKITEPAQYSDEGGKGLEFGTFNNLHTSLFTRDYRFNQDGLVYAVTRQDPVAESSGKIDYPTQLDDFKDVVDASLCADWKSIVKTSFAMNGTKSRSVKMDGSFKGDAGWVDSNLEIKTKTTYMWVKTPGEFVPSTEQKDAAISIAFAPAVGVLYDGNDPEIYDESTGEFKYTPSALKLNKTTIQEQLWSEAQLYEQNSAYYVLNEIESPGIKLESDGNVKLIAKKKVAAEAPMLEYVSGTDGVEITTGNEVAFDKSTTGVGMMIQSPIVKFDGPVVKQYNSMNISAAGKLETGGYLQSAGVFNLQHSNVKYDSSNNLAYVLIETVYNESGTAVTSFEPDPNNDTKVKVYWDSAHTQPCAFLGKDGQTYESGAKVYLTQTSDSTKLWACDTTKKGEMKAPKKAYDSATGELSTGDAEHIIVATRQSTGVYKGLAGTEYENTVYVTSASSIPSSANITIQPTREWEAETESVEISDIVKLVKWMKENSQGPWA